MHENMDVLHAFFWILIFINQKIKYKLIELLKNTEKDDECNKFKEIIQIY
jgi:hypothetical protein